MIFLRSLRLKQITFLTLVAIFCLTAWLPGFSQARAEENPFLAPPSLFDEAIPFDQIEPEHYLPAIEVWLSEQLAIVETIKANPATPDFNNTIAPLYTQRRQMANTYDLLLTISELAATPELEPVLDAAVQKVTEVQGKIAQDPKLFQRIKFVYEKADRSQLSPEEITLLEMLFRQAEILGVNLTPEDQEKFNKLQQNIKQAGNVFNRNLMADREASILHVTDKNRLRGIPEEDLQQAAELAVEADLDGWLFTVNSWLLSSILDNADDRSLREEAWRQRAFLANKNDANDNKQVILDIVNQRLEVAQLLGRDSFASLTLEDRMAKTPAKVDQFLADLATPTVAGATLEIQQLLTYVEKVSPGLILEPWDYWYYEGKLRTAAEGTPPDEIRLFALDNALSGVFSLYDTLYGLEFRRNTTLPVYHPDVRVYEVWDKEANRYMGLLYMDLFTRERKGGGAFASMLRSQYRDRGDDVRPHALIMCNFQPPGKDKPALLTHDDLRTLLHESGHGMHVLLSDVDYAATSGYNAQWDYVEMPSTIMENFIYDPDFLRQVGRHYQTGEALPEAYLEAVQAERSYMANRYLLAAIQYSKLDASWHEIKTPVTTGVRLFELDALKSLNVRPPGRAVNESIVSGNFTHLFSGGYAASYYGYLWSEALAGSAYERLRAGGTINTAAARLFRQEILSKGGSESADILFGRFDPKFAAAGSQPDPSVILRRRELVRPVELPDGFVYLDKVLQNASYDVRYYTSNNFLGKRVDGYLAPKVILSQEAAQALAKVEKELAAKGYELKIFDGYRPQRAVDHFVRWAKDLKDTKMKPEYYPQVEKSDLFRLGYIAAKSGHSRGSTVDLTLLDAKTGKELDMGSSFDFFGPVSHHGTSLITEQQTANRNILRDAMLAAGYKLYDEEWWHYTLKNEPYPNSYFNFVVR